MFLLVIPQTCRYKSKKYECGLSISCVLSGGKPMDLCSGGMIWSCCVDIIQQDVHDEEQSPTNSLNNASKYEIHFLLVRCQFKCSHIELCCTYLLQK